MTDKIYGELYGSYINGSHFMGSFKSSTFVGNLNGVKLLNDNIFDGNIDNNNIIGSLSGSYEYLYNKGTTNASINGSIVDKTTVDMNTLLSPINEFIKSISSNVKIIHEDDKFKLNIDDTKENIILINNMYSKDLTNNNKLIIVKNNVFYNITVIGNDVSKMWNIPYDNVVSYVVLCQMSNVNVIPKAQPRNKLYDDINNEMNSIYNELINRNNNKHDFSIKKKTNNNLFTPYTVFRYPLNKNFNNAFGESLGLVKNIDLNNELPNMYYVFNDSNDNNHYGSQNGNNVVLNNDDIYNTIYNFEKYNKYKLKININDMTEDDKQNIIKQYSNIYKLAIIKDNNIIYGIYIMP